MKLYISCQSAITEVQGFQMPDLSADRDPSPKECERLAAAVLDAMPKQDIEELRADGKTPIVLITITRRNGTNAYAQVSDLSETPEFVEWFGEDTTRPDEFILMIQEPMNCTELGIEFRPIWFTLCRAPVVVTVAQSSRVSPRSIRASRRPATQPHRPRSRC